MRGRSWTANAARVLILGALAVLLASSALEEAVHSVHHLPDHARASHCAIAAVAAELAATPVAPVILVAPAMRPVETLVEVAPSAASPVPFRPDRGRAPPPLSLA